MLLSYLARPKSFFKSVLGNYKPRLRVKSAGLSFVFMPRLRVKSAGLIMFCKLGEEPKFNFPGGAADDLGHGRERRNQLFFHFYLLIMLISPLGKGIIVS